MIFSGPKDHHNTTNENTTMSITTEAPSTATVADITQRIASREPALRCGYVRVNNWNNRRRIVIYPQFIWLEIYRLSCACQTCLGRASEIALTLQSKPNIQYNYLACEEGFWLILAKDRKADPLKYAKEILNLTRLEFAG